MALPVPAPTSAKPIIAVTPAGGLADIPRGKIKAFREFLNRQNAELIGKEAAKAADSLVHLSTKHRHGRFRQVKRLYGDYLYAQDRDKFMVDLRDWLVECSPEESHR